MRNWLIVAARSPPRGYALTLYVFYPGVMTYDAKYIYLATKAAQPGDWQSPVMVAIWKRIDPLAPGAASMFLLIVTTLLARLSALLALSLARRSLLARGRSAACSRCLPPAFTLLGIIWRDMLFAAAWLLAAVLAWCVRRAAHAIARSGRRSSHSRLPRFGMLLRPNALFATPLSRSISLWPAAFRFKRTALLYVPAGRSPSMRWCRSSITAR